MKNYHIAVLDVGKTNKKVLIYDQDLKVVDQSIRSFDELTNGNLIFDDVENIWEWFKEALKHFATQYDLKIISVTTHGATFTCLDEEGELAVPEICYTTDPGPEFQQDFYRKFGDLEELQKTTATPPFDALINMAKGIYFIKKKYPDGFYRVKHILNYPQFFGYKLTGIPGAEHTYVGCHTYLWDFESNEYSEVAHKLGIIDLLPQEVKMPWEELGKVTPQLAKELNLSPETVVTMGIHDSNASLLPYTIQMEGDFILNSTGTWCVVMHEQDQVSFQSDELGKIVFYNINAFGKPVKTAIFLGGLEFDSYSKLFRRINDRTEYPGFNLAHYQRVIQEQSLFILPSITKGTGQFPDSDPRIIENGKIYQYQEVESGENIPEFFKDFELAYAVLNISLVIQTSVALRRAGISKGVPIFTEGGFRKNNAYNSLLTALYPDSPVATTNLDEATSFGAGILAKANLEKVTPLELKETFQIEKNEVERIDLPGLKDYIDKFNLYLSQ